MIDPVIYCLFNKSENFKMKYKFYSYNQGFKDPDVCNFEDYVGRVTDNKR